MSGRNELIERELDGLRRYARALGSDRDQANDLVQETVMSALRHWDKWKGTGPLRAWMFTIMRNRFYEDARKRQRWQAVAVSDEDAAERQAAPAGLDPMVLRDVARALGGLTAEQREIVFLVCVEGMSYEETARMTATPVGTVMSRLARARARLKAETGGL